MINYFKNIINNKQLRTVTLSLISFGTILLLTAFVVGIEDNPLGIALLFIAITALIFAFIHTWDKSKNYLILLLVSVIGFVISVLFHNLFDAFAGMNSETIIIHNIFIFFSVLFFFLGVIIFPVTAFVGIIGSITMYFNNKSKSIL